jgi:hypothetical protein
MVGQKPWLMRALFRFYHGSKQRRNPELNWL